MTQLVLSALGFTVITVGLTLYRLFRYEGTEISLPTIFSHIIIGRTPTVFISLVVTLTLWGRILINLINLIP
jgi:hypothetical protein